MSIPSSDRSFTSLCSHVTHWCCVTTQGRGQWRKRNVKNPFYPYGASWKNQSKIIPNRGKSTAMYTSEAEDDSPITQISCPVHNSNDRGLLPSWFSWQSILELVPTAWELVVSFIKTNKKCIWCLCAPSNLAIINYCVRNQNVISFLGLISETYLKLGGVHVFLPRYLAQPRVTLLQSSSLCHSTLLLHPSWVFSSV